MLRSSVERNSKDVGDLSVRYPKEPSSYSMAEARTRKSNGRRMKAHCVGMKVR
jgi:hypothetical protein